MERADEVDTVALCQVSAHTPLFDLIAHLPHSHAKYLGEASTPSSSDGASDSA